MAKSEEALRREAVEQRQRGTRSGAVAQALGRSVQWVWKWWGRFRRDGEGALAGLSRAPHVVANKLPAAMGDKVIAARRNLEKGGTRHTQYAGYGPEAVRWELERQGVKPLPSPSSIARILRSCGLSGRSRPRRSKSGRAYPGPVARKAGDLMETDLVGPRHLRGKEGVIRFFSIHSLDIASRAAATSQHANKSASSLLHHLLRAWKLLGVPRVWQTDHEMAAEGSRRHYGNLSQAVRFALLLGVRVLFIPPGEPGRNAHIESFNELWQERVLRRHHMGSRRALRLRSQGFETYYNLRRPHRALSVKGHGSRFPGEVLRLAGVHRRRLSPAFWSFLQRYRNAEGKLSLPVARGRVTYILLVEEDGSIELQGKRLVIGKRHTGQYAKATIFTHRRQVRVQVNHRVVKVFPFPIRERLVAPLRKLRSGRV